MLSPVRGRGDRTGASPRALATRVRHQTRVAPGWRPRPGSLAALAVEQLHQQRIVPAATVDITLGFTHHTNPPEADLLVSPDRGRVGHGGVDRDAVMTALVEQQADNLRDGLGTDATAVQLRV